MRGPAAPRVATDEQGRDLGAGGDMANDPVDTRSGSRSTRLGLVGLGMVIGAIVTLILVFAARMF